MAISPVWAAVPGLVIATGVMSVVVLAVLVSAWVVTAAVQVRAAAPGTSWGACLAAGPSLVVGTGRRSGAPAPGHDALGSAVAGVGALLLVPAALSALVFLLVGEHLRSAVGSVGAGPVTAAVGTIVVILAATLARQRRALTPQARSWLAKRGPHIATVAVAGELLLAAAVSVTAIAFAHTIGSLLSVVEAGAAAVLARAMTVTAVPARGIILADAILFGALMWIGTPASAALTTTVLWRASMTLFRWLPVRHARDVGDDLGARIALPEAPTGSRLGETVHRLAFRVIARLPAAAARRIRRRLFHALFCVADDPWQYESMPYEQRKRELLVASIPSPARTILEIGCADGHNLLALANRFPDSLIVGVDISSAAVHYARARTAGRDNVRVIESDARGAASALRAAGCPPAEVLVLAEVLYYLGSRRRIGDELRGLRSAMAPTCHVVLLHPASDVGNLHDAAMRALEATAWATRRMPDHDRPCIVDVGTRAPHAPAAGRP